MKTVKLGWNTSDNIAGALADLLAANPDNKPLRELSEHFSSGSDEPLTIVFEDEQED